MKKLSTIVIALFCLSACMKQQVYPVNPEWPALQEIDHRFQLSSFAAKRTGTDVQLSVTTAWERNIIGLEVLRGTSLKEFCVINSIVPIGNSTTPRTYTLLDQVDTGTSVFYLVKYTSSDGTSGYSAPFKAVE